MILKKYKGEFKLTFEKGEFNQFQGFIITCLNADKKIGFNRLFDYRDDKEILQTIKQTLGFREIPVEGIQNVACNLTMTSQ